MRAKGFWGRCLRLRRRATADSFVASQARWKPPMPLRARMRPWMRARRAAVIAGERAGAEGAEGESGSRRGGVVAVGRGLPTGSTLTRPAGVEGE